MDQETIDKFDDMIRRTARRVANDFPNIDHQDIHQELWVFVLSSSTLVDPERYGMKSMLYKRARTIAWNMRKEDLRNTAQYSYTVSDVRLILETCFDYDDWWGSFVPRDAKEGEKDQMAALEVRVDAMIAFDQLPDDYKEYITERFASRIIPEPGSKESKRLNRAVKRLTENMNTYYVSSLLSGHPGSRHAMSNSSMNYTIQKQEQE